MRETAPSRKSAVSRADLLSLLYELPAEQAPQVAALLGFRCEDAREEERAPPPSPPKEKVLGEETLPPLRQPLRATHFALIEQQRYPEEARPAHDQLAGDGSVFTSLQSAPAAPPPPRIALSQPARLAIFLQRTLRIARPGHAIDTPRLLGHLARASLPRHLPRYCRPRWNCDALLLIDLSLAAWPLREDLIDLAERAHSLSAGRLTVVCRDAASGWLRRLPGRAPVWQAVDDLTLTNARQWLIAGDLGSFGADPASRHAWQACCRAQRARSGELTLLGQAGASATLPRQTRVVSWEHGRRLIAARPARRSGASVPDEAGTSRLLAALSLAVVVEPTLLRAVRLALGLPMACELAAWNHPDSESCVLGMQIRRERLAEYRRQLLTQTALDQRQLVARIVAAHHAGHYQAIRFEEAALAADLADLDAEQARADWARAVRTLRDAPGGEAARELASYLGRTGARAHPGLWHAVSPLADAYVLARSEELLAGEAIPEGLPASSLERLLSAPGPAGDARPWWLMQVGSKLLATIRPPQAGEFVFIELRPCAGFDLEVPQQGRQWHSLAAADEVLATLQPGAGPWIVRSANEKVVIAEVPRPSWALEWGRDRQGLYALAPSLPEPTAKLYWQAADEPLLRWPPAARGFLSPRQQIGRGFWQGADLDYGLYLDVEIAGVVQRFRWIEPGEFWMGSLDDEAGRVGEEWPRRRVRLTCGFWLAETACTQALWQAVMSNNPSEFPDDAQKPVETVSWDDVQGFVQRVATILPGVAAELPSEAQWEYACRAGSETAYSWGNEISPEQANYDGKKQGTVAVKSYPPNPWGLYEMHGNVWEWCADGERTDDGRAHKSASSIDGLRAPIVMRGGSWSSGGDWLRASTRYLWLPSIRYGARGFRFSLRFTGLAGGAERLPPEEFVLAEAEPKYSASGFGILSDSRAEFVGDALTATSKHAPEVVDCLLLPKPRTS